MNLSEELTQLEMEFPPHEEWGDMPGYEDCYQVSNLGRVVTKQSRVRGYKAGTEIRQTTVKEGYVTVTLTKDGRKRRLYVHQAVMLAFVGEANGLDVNHKNGIKGDNRLVNLEYCTRHENIMHCIRVLGKVRAQYGETHRDAKLTVSQVIEIKRRLVAGDGRNALAREFGVSETTIYSIKSGRNWKRVEAG